MTLHCIPGQSAGALLWKGSSASHSSFHENWLRAFDEASKVCITCSFPSFLFFFSFFKFFFFCQLNMPQPNHSHHFLKKLYCPASCPHFIFGFTCFCTTTLFIYLIDFSVLKNNKLKQKSHLRPNGQYWKLALLMKTMHVTCDIEVEHGTRPNSSLHGNLSHLLCRT